jgi:hypothetical protein
VPKAIPCSHRFLLNISSFSIFTTCRAIFSASFSEQQNARCRVNPNRCNHGMEGHRQSTLYILFLLHLSISQNSSAPSFLRPHQAGIVSISSDLTTRIFKQPTKDFNIRDAFLIVGSFILLERFFENSKNSMLSESLLTRSDLQLKVRGLVLMLHY